MKEPLADKKSSTGREPILLLVHRIPYPPNKGDKIRSFNLLKFLSKTFDVYLGAFIDDPVDKKYISKVEEYCKEACLIEINPRQRKLASLSAFFTNQALSIPYYKNRQMQTWVNDIVTSKAIKKHLVYSSPMAQYIRTISNAELKVIDFVDVDSEKWKQYSEKHTGLMKWVYAREARQLLKFEKQIADEFDCSLFVSKNEANLFKQLAAVSNEALQDKITYYSNGVDTTYFSPAIELENPYVTHGNNTQIMVFTGAMDYWANQEAVLWFAETIFPMLKEKCPDACFYIVGSRPSEKIKRLAEKEGIFVIGGVNDIRPYIAFADLVTAPLRIARGIQNKVLEAMAMARPVVATHAAMDGIASSFNKNTNDDFKLYTSDSAEDLVQICTKILTEGDQKNLGEKGRELVINHFSWDSHLAKVTKHLTMKAE